MGTAVTDLSRKISEYLGVESEKIFSGTLGSSGMLNKQKWVAWAQRRSGRGRSSLVSLLYLQMWRLRNKDERRRRENHVLSQVGFEILICFLAGAGAGLGTGFAGLSAATVITPMLVVFLGVPAYQAIGIALASDVLASAASARTYAKNGCVDIRNGIAMMVGVLSMTVVGSWLSSYVESSTLGGFSILMTWILGVRFLFFPILAPKDTMRKRSGVQQICAGLAGGALVGLICGFFGAGGGMMMLMVLTMLLGYELKTAVGTSVFVMTFSALTGAISHFALGDAPNLRLLVLCMIFTLAWAQGAAKVAARSSPIALNRWTGMILTSLGTLLLVVNVI